jgi:hypothetical protein
MQHKKSCKTDEDIHQVILSIISISSKLIRFKTLDFISKSTLMNKSTLLLTVFIVMLSTYLIGCENLSKSVQENTNKQNIDITNPALLEEIENYKREMEKTIDSNDQKIIHFKAKTDFKKEKHNYDYRHAILELELQNCYMKMKLDKYATEGIEEWEIFKAEYACQLLELNKEFARFSDTN